MLPFCAEGTQGYLTGSKRERESAALPENISRALNREPRKGHGYSEGRVFERGLAYNGRATPEVDWNGMRAMRGRTHSGEPRPPERAPAACRESPPESQQTNRDRRERFAFAPARR